VLALVVSFLCRPMARYFGLMDVPSARKRHYSVTPLTGGFVFLATLSIAFLVTEPPDKFQFLGGFLCAIFFLGALDDRFGLNASLRLVVQLAVSSTAFTFANISMNSIGPFGGMELSPGLLSIPLAVLFVVGFVNAFNMIDGIDGLASGQACITLTALVVAQWLSSEEVVHLPWFVTLIAGILAFFCINVFCGSRFKSFLGDGGSTTIGFLIGWLIVDLSQVPGRVIHPIFGAWVIFYPCFDFIGTVLRRHRLGVALMSADRNHVHHILIDSGVDMNTVLLVILGFSSVITSLGIMVSAVWGALHGLALFVACMGVSLYLARDADQVTRFYFLLFSPSKR